MLRALLAVVVGAIGAGSVVFLLEAASHAAFPLPEGVDPRDPAQLATVMQQAPLAAKLAVVAAWGLGAFAGAAVATYVSGGLRWPGYVVGALILAGVIASVTAFPHPVWMIGAGLVAPVVGAFVAARLLRRRAA